MGRRVPKFASSSALPHSISRASEEEVTPRRIVVLPQLAIEEAKTRLGLSGGANSSRSSGSAWNAGSNALTSRVGEADEDGVLITE